MELVVTVDAEEDQWGPASSAAPSVTNVWEVPALQKLFNHYQVVPTYLLTYPVAHDEKSSTILRGLLDAGQCEIGMHCHPWNTPPYQEPMTRHNSMLCNLPASLQSQKLHLLHETIHKRFGGPPLAFRSGRWGFGVETAGVLARLGCRVDTSITPYTSWTASEGPDFSSYSPHAFAFSSADLSRNDRDGDMVEVPVTIGYVGGSFARCHQLHKRLNSGPFRRLHAAGLFAKLGLVRSVWFSPERETPARLMRLLRQSMREGCAIANLFFHTSSLRIGCTPFVRTREEKTQFLSSLTTILDFCRACGVRNVPLSQAAQRIFTQSQSVLSACNRADHLYAEMDQMHV
jgi:hypothetical protein